MIKKINITKKSRQQLFDQHVGTGTIVYKSAEKQLTYINFYIGRNDGKMYNSGTGKLITEFSVIDED